MAASEREFSCGGVVVRGADCIVIVTNHTHIDYARLTELAGLVVDTRNALNGDLRRGSRARIIRL